MQRRRTIQAVPLLLMLHGCVGGQTGESPGDPQPSHVELDAGCQPPDCPAPTPDELDAFSSLVGGGGARRDVPPDGGLDEFASISDIVLLGELTGVGEGRNEDIGLAWTYKSYVNLLIRPISIFRGELEDDAQVALEFSWPSNAPLDRLIAAAPRGARLLLFANRVRDAEEGARPLAEAGIAIGTIAPNLFWVHEYGLGFENSDGFVDPDAFDGDAFIRLVTNTTPRDLPPLPFQTAIEAVMTSVSKL